MFLKSQQNQYMWEEIEYLSMYNLMCLNQFLEGGGCHTLLSVIVDLSIFLFIPVKYFLCIFFMCFEALLFKGVYM